MSDAALVPCPCPVCNRTPQVFRDKFLWWTKGFVVKCSHDSGDGSFYEFHTIMFVDFNCFDSAIVNWNLLYRKEKP